jgi:hypothetical protein
MELPIHFSGTEVLSGFRTLPSEGQKGLPQEKQERITPRQVGKPAKKPGGNVGAKPGEAKNKEHLHNDKMEWFKNHLSMLL